MLPIQAPRRQDAGAEPTGMYSWRGLKRWRSSRPHQSQPTNRITPQPFCRTPPSQLVTRRDQASSNQWINFIG
jgi:hypothetical protein